MPTSAEVHAMLTGPGGAFEVVTEEVRGVPLKVFKQRMRSLREIAAAAQGRGDDQLYLVYGDRRIGFTSFVGQANAVSAGLGARGIGRGDRVAVLSANNPEWVQTFWATVDMGAVLVGLNGWWKADEIVFGLDDSGAKVLVADGPRFERIADRLHELPALEHVFLVGAGGELPSGPVPIHDFAELLAGGGDDVVAALPDVPIDEDDPAVIFYTSGTTGRPKGAISTHRSMLANVQNTFYGTFASAMAGNGGISLGGDGAQPAALLTSPLFHVSGCHSGMVVGLLGGVKLVIPVGKFEPEKAMQLIQDEKVSIWATVPTMVWRVV